jgi:hypothetical protein
MNGNSAEEYKELQHLREVWSNVIMGYNKKFIPIGAGAISLAIYSFRIITTNYFYFTPLLLWVLFAFCMWCWRSLCHHVDTQIVGMYYRMMELEKQLTWEIQCKYYYANLNDEAKKLFSSKMNTNFNDISNFLSFKATAINQNKDFYNILLDTYSELSKSVTGRGHSTVDWIVVWITTLFFVAIIARMLIPF